MRSFCTVMVLLCLTAARAAEIKHTFVCLDNRRNQLVYVDQFAPGNSWRVPVPKGSRDLCLLDRRRVLVSHPDGASIYQLADGTSVPFVRGLQGVTSASRTPSGTFLLGGPDGFREFDESGRLLRTIQPQGPVEHLRLVRIQPNGNLLYCAEFTVYEIDPDGTVLREHTTKGKSYLALRQSDGSILSTTAGEV